MCPENFNKYNVADMLLSVEDAMYVHITSIENARLAIAALFDELEEQSIRICYLESILKNNNIDF